MSKSGSRVRRRPRNIYCGGWLLYKNCPGMPEFMGLYQTEVRGREDMTAVEGDWQVKNVMFIGWGAFKIEKNQHLPKFHAHVIGWLQYQNCSGELRFMGVYQTEGDAVRNVRECELKGEWLIDCVKFIRWDAIEIGQNGPPPEVHVHVH